MTLSDHLATDAAALVSSDDFGETVTWLSGVNAPYTLSAQVSDFEAVDSSGGRASVHRQAQVIVVDAAFDADTPGVTLPSHGDKLKAKSPLGGSDYELRVERIRTGYGIHVLDCKVGEVVP